MERLNVKDSLEYALNLLKDEVKSKETAMTVTKIEEALLWYDKI